MRKQFKSYLKELLSNNIRKTNSVILFSQYKIQRKTFIEKIITNKRNKHCMIKENDKKKKSFLTLKLKQF